MTTQIYGLKFYIKTIRVFLLYLKHGCIINDELLLFNFCKDYFHYCYIKTEP